MGDYRCLPVNVGIGSKSGLAGSFAIGTPQAFVLAAFSRRAGCETGIVTLQLLDGLDQIGLFHPGNLDAMLHGNLFNLC